MNRRTTMIYAVGLVAALALWMWQRERRDGTADSPTTDPDVSARRASLSQRARIAPQQLPTGSISGTVRARAGEAIGDAQVCVTPRSNQLAGEDTKIPNCTRTDAQGRYQLVALVPARYQPESSARGFKPGAYRAKQRGQPNWLRVEPGQALTGVDMELDPGGVGVTGFVGDVGGGPVAGARVSGIGLDGWSHVSGATHSIAGEDGRFELWLPAGRVMVMASAEGYTRGRAQVSAPGSAVEILLTPEAALAGRVVEAGSGTPVARAQVVANPTTEEFFSWGERLPPDPNDASVFTDQEGRFRIPGLAPGRYKPMATAAGGYGEADPSVRLGLGQTEENIVIEVQPAAIVVGRVLVGQGDTACISGSVSLSRVNDAGNPLDSAVDGDQGRVEFLAVLPGRYRVAVQCDNKQSRLQYDDVEVAGKDIEGLVWRVDDGASVAGTVRSREGAVVGDGTVSVQGVMSDNPRAQQALGSGVLEPDGAYRIDGLAPGKARVSVEAPGFPEPEPPVETILVTGKTTRVDIELSAGGTIRGVVVDEQRAPIAQLVVHARPLEKDNGWSSSASVPSRDDGTFELTGLSPGNYRVRAYSAREPGKSDDDVIGEVVDVVAGQASAATLVVESRNKTISGTVVGSAGEPITDAHVSAVRESDAVGAVRGGSVGRLRWGVGGNKSVVTDTDGAFELKELARGNYTVQAYRRGGGEALVERVAAGARVELRIDTPGSIAGRVVTSGPPPLLFTIRVHDKTTSFVRSERFVGTQGRFLMGDLPAGTYQCSVTSEQGVANAEVRVNPGAKVQGVELKVAGLVTLTGRVVDLQTRKPVPGLRMIAQAGSGAPHVGFADDDAANDNVTDSNGRFTIKDAPQGLVDVMGFGVDRQDSPYQWIHHRVTVAAEREFDLGELVAVRKRVEKGQVVGDLGFTLQQASPSSHLENRPLVVALVRPGGPAAESGLQVGDEIVAIDGNDITENTTQYWILSRVPPGTKIELGLRRGGSAAIVAGPPRE